MLTGNYLISTDDWFFAPDGQQYKAVWGKAQVLSDEDGLGIKTNERSTNWYVFVGDDEKGMIVAGCQVHYAVLCKNRPSNADCLMDRDGMEYSTSSRIYFAQ